MPTKSLYQARREARGWKRIEDICVGEELSDGDGSGTRRDYREPNGPDRFGEGEREGWAASVPGLRKVAHTVDSERRAVHGAGVAVFGLVRGVGRLGPIREGHHAN